MVATVLVGQQGLTRDTKVLPEATGLVLAARFRTFRRWRRRRRWVGWRAEDLIVTQIWGDRCPWLVRRRGWNTGQVVKVFDVDRSWHFEELLDTRGHSTLMEVTLFDE